MRTAKGEGEMTRTNWWRLAAGIGAAALLAGCAGKVVSPAASQSSSAPAASSDAPIATDQPNGDYQATAAVGHEIVADSTITVTFDGSRIVVNAGCNIMSGAYTIDSGRLVVGEMMMTAMGCPQPLMDQDAWVAAFLGSSPDVSSDGSTVTLTGRGVVAESLTLSAIVEAAASPLEGTTWLLNTIVNGDAASSVPAGVVATLRIDQGQLSLSAQCNQIHGPVTVADGMLTVTGLMSTKMACEGDRGQVEALLVAAFSAPVPYEISGDRLMVGDAASSLVFLAQPPAPDTTALETAAPDTTAPDTTAPEVAPSDLVIPTADSSTPDRSIPAIPEPTG